MRRRRVGGVWKATALFGKHQCYTLKARPGTNDYYADFRVEQVHYEYTGAVWSRVAEGFVKFDGCVNVTVSEPDGCMLHFCDSEGIAEFGAALIAARALAATLMPHWEGDVHR